MVDVRAARGCGTTPPHVHVRHGESLFVFEGESTFHLRDSSHVLPARTLIVFPPGVVHGFDNDSDAFARSFDFHMPSIGFVDTSADATPSSTRTTRPRTAASTRRPLSSRVSGSNVAA